MRELTSRADRATHAAAHRGRSDQVRAAPGRAAIARASSGERRARSSGYEHTASQPAPRAGGGGVISFGIDPVRVGLGAGVLARPADLVDRASATDGRRRSSSRASACWRRGRAPVARTTLMLFTLRNLLLASTIVALSRPRSGAHAEDDDERRHQHRARDRPLELHARAGLPAAESARGREGRREAVHRRAHERSHRRRGVRRRRR